jgi:hypothetical protein
MVLFLFRERERKGREGIAFLGRYSTFRYKIHKSEASWDKLATLDVGQDG